MDLIGFNTVTWYLIKSEVDSRAELKGVIDFERVFRNQSLRKRAMAKRRTPNSRQYALNFEILYGEEHFKTFFLCNCWI